MLRFRILASTIPLLLAAFFARGEWPGTQPCIAIGETAVQIATSPWQPQLHVSFTDDPAAATVRVQILESPEAADFAVIDDGDASAEAGSCAMTAATRFIGISETPEAAAPVIYLSDRGDADYRIFVNSKTFTPRDAAALIVSARGRPNRMASAAL